MWTPLPPLRTAFYVSVRRETSRRCVRPRPQAAEELENLYEKKLAKEARRYDELRKLLDDTRYEVEDKIREQAMQHEQHMRQREDEFAGKLRQERERQAVLEDRNLDTRCVPVEFASRFASRLAFVQVPPLRASELMDGRNPCAQHPTATPNASTYHYLHPP